MITGCSSKPAPSSATDKSATRADAEKQAQGTLPTITSTPLALRDDSQRSVTLFEKLPAEATGIDLVHTWKPRDNYEMQQLKTGFTGGGVCLGDYDGDGLCDVFVTRPFEGARLYRNLGNFRFEDVTTRAGVEDNDSWTTGATFVDVNNDQWLDLCVCGYNTPTRMLLNQGDGTFIDVAQKSGLDFRGAGVKMVFADYDRDGDLDGFLVTNRLEPRVPPKIRYLGSPGQYTVAPEHQELVGVINLPDGKQQFTKAGQFDLLLKNQLAETGVLRFSDVTKTAGIEGNYHGLDATWWDYNSDGLADLYIANDFTDPDQLYRNNGDGTFTDVTNEAVPNTPWFAMGAAAGDLNRDGRFDLVATDMAGTTHYREKMAMGSMDAVAWFLDTAEPRQYMRNALYLNTGTSRFMEVAHLAGLASSNWTWSVKVADLDLDGREDVFVTNGFTRDYLNSDFNEGLRKAGREQDSNAWYEAPELNEANMAFHNLGDLHFQNAAQEWGLDDVGISFGAAVGDLDNDGDLDLVTINFEGQPSVYRNHTTQGHRIKIRLQSDEFNTYGVGAILTLETPTAKHLRRVNCGGGFMSSDESFVYVGLGDEPTVTKLTIQWPDGTTQHHSDLQADQYYVIRQATSAKQVEAPTPSTTATIFHKSDLLAQAKHKETPYDDFQRQPLLPAKLSQLGPGIAWGDVNGDERDDLYLSGAAGQPGQLFVRTADGNFEPAEIPAFSEDSAHEDMGCLFFDVDSDGDLDLYVVSGGVECEPNDEVLRDRLYLNETPAESDNVQFVQANDRVPDVRDSGGPVVAADFDRDGDLDLFVGGRVVPGAYPTSPTSRLLQNDDGHLIDVTDSMAPVVAQTGMVTSSLWTDVDSDGWLDLMVTLEYGSIKLFRNQDGKLQDDSLSANLSELLGWWNAINGCDIDLDGDIDYVVTNLGRNTKYHPAPDHPQLVYYGDFEGTGRKRIVEAKTGADCLLPVRGRSCSSNAMPFLRDKLDSYHAFATATLGEIYTETRLDDALRLEVTTSDSGTLINDGSGHFEFRPLPWLAQTSPGFGLQFLHANNDQYPDLFIAQNFNGPQRETGRMNGGVGILLLGSGDGNWQPIWPVESGIVIPGDATAVTATDLNEDGWDDLLVAQNNEQPAVFLSNSHDRPQSLQVRLAGNSKNSIGEGTNGVGTKIVAQYKSGKRQAAEVYAGCGYLTQSTTTIKFANPTTDPLVSIEAIWPDGSNTQTNVDAATQQLTIRP